MDTFTQLFGISQSSLRLSMMNLDEVSNNLANINTNGFKSKRLDFQEMLSNNQLNGAQLSSAQVNMAPGSLKTTDKELDIAISGEGFFAVKLPDGTIGYSRDGSFQRDINGTIVNDSGYPLVWSGSIPADGKDIRVGYDGTVTYTSAADGSQQPAGNIPLYSFVNPSGLDSEGNNIWKETPASGPVASGTPELNGYGSLQDRTLESSNVDMAEQTTDTILIQRTYQVALSALKQSDQMIDQAIRMRTA
jgi:flagellar basal-body rod protein FlgG